MAKAEARYTLTAVDKTKSAFASVSSRIKSVGKQVAKFGAAAVVGGGIAGFVSQLKEVTTLARRSKRLGVPIEQLSRLGFVAKRSGVSTQEFLTGLQRLRRRAEEAARGSGEAQKEIARLNLNAEAFAKAGAVEQIIMLSRGLSTMDTGQLATTFKFLDTEGVGFLQFLKDGPDAIRALMTESDRLGNTVTEAMGKSAIAIDEAWTNLTSAIGGGFKILIERFGPQIANLINSIADAIPRLIENFGKFLTQLDMFIPKARKAQEIYREATSGPAGAAAVAGRGAVGLRRGLQSAALGFLGFKKPESLLEASVTEQKRTNTLLTTAVQSGGFAFGIGE